MNIHVREAALVDVAEIDRQTRQIAGTIFDWPAAIASDDPRVITRVATVGDEVVGHIATGLSYGRTVIGDEHPEDLGWLKIHTLAVLPTHRDHGIASQLLQATIAALPREVVGVYGSVILSNTPTAVDWYRARGFLVSTVAELWNPRLGKGARLLTEPDQAYFSSDVHTLRYWSGKHATEQSEIARVQKGLDQEMKLRAKAGRVSGSIGYRAFADHAIATSSGSCVHLQLAPMRSHLLGWDPERRIVCESCYFGHLEAIRQYDADNRCDGCGLFTTGVHVATVPRELTLVTSGLCQRCAVQTEFNAV
ncbi:acetyltransferase (GNAT) family protein [Curtobacterium sp. PhB142]|uniref:GNAT family N-acetyltransferase n=1 Tax=unclassified Curtobacterium TaxID=257496 RepID=UPI00104B0740|nr:MULTISPECIES: GNAT family N-acetyltransferase [unclassified Curtobacterium]TCL87843.1 acetyltransferase (GNAT) family protein [Curtobacterium sp. PhB142]TCM04808.1 acetyltransferase (GNAT) family protein [Curtobacterium sp. PhB134]